ncbi:sulfite exporter TauE/SafE family protein [Niallia sp.]|uniref:urease accessory protein UreH domain-containing protein n=1 Tax=Niallia sp. TaxID=2837523 RepID=UPI00289E30C7|nr:sulfite exporter TauE/SafE family protein [Niallia sp.]
MYDLFSQFSYFLGEPFLRLARSSEDVPLLFAFMLGLVGALAPCQFTGNLGAVTFYGNISIQGRMQWKQIFFFVLGKITVFTLIGLFVWIVGNEVKSVLSLYFPWFRKIVGPMLVFIGLYLLSIIKYNKFISLGGIPEKLFRKGNLGAFLMGVSLTLGFCPTMFVLFFVTLMPMAVTVSYGLFLPSIFGLGTSLPLLLALFLLWNFELNDSVMKKTGRKIGSVVQKIAGIFLLVLGMLDTITYWGI